MDSAPGIYRGIGIGFDYMYIKEYLIAAADLDICWFYRAVLIFGCACSCLVHECTCGPGLYACKDGKTCLPADKVCDGNGDCPNSDDEQACGQYMFFPNNIIKNIFFTYMYVNYFRKNVRGLTLVRMKLLFVSV